MPSKNAEVLHRQHKDATEFAKFLRLYKKIFFCCALVTLSVFIYCIVNAAGFLVSLVSFLLFIDTAVHWNASKYHLIYINGLIKQISILLKIESDLVAGNSNGI